MAETDPNLPHFMTSWLTFTKKVKILLVPRSNDRGLDQFMEFRDKVMKIVSNPAFLEDIQSSYELLKSDKKPIDEAIIRDTLIMEIDAFNRGVSMEKGFSKKKPKKRSLIKWLERASTVTGSVDALLGDLPWPTRSAITLFKELLDIFKK